MNCILPHDGPIFEELEGAEQTVAKHQADKFIPIRALIDGTRHLTRWTPTEEQRKAIAAGADLYVESLSFGRPLQALRLTVGMTIDEAKDILGLTEPAPQE